MRICLFLAAASAVFCFASEFQYHLSVPLDGLAVNQRLGYLRMDIEGCVSAGEPGEPVLPCIPVTLVVPSGAENVTVSCVTGGAFRRVLQGRVEPVAVPRPFSSTASVTPVVTENPGIYSSNRFWPDEPVRNVRTGCKSGFSLVSFMVYPVSYNPVSNEITVHLLLYPPIR